MHRLQRLRLASLARHSSPGRLRPDVVERFAEHFLASGRSRPGKRVARQRRQTEPLETLRGVLSEYAAIEGLLLSRKR